MSFEMSYWNQLGFLSVLSKMPDKNIALEELVRLSFIGTLSYRVGTSAECRSIARNRNTRNRYVFFGDQLVRAIILCQVPNSNTPTLVAANDFALVWVNDYIIDRCSMGITALHSATPSLPDFDCAILRACTHPLSLAVKLNACDIACMTFERKERVGVGGFYIVKLYRMISSSREEALIRGNAKTVDLGIRVLDGS